MYLICLKKKNLKYNPKNEYQNEIIFKIKYIEQKI